LVKKNGKGGYGKSTGKSFQWDAKGKGKASSKGGSFWNKGGKNDGKGGKGKGKEGKGGFQGDCYWCGKYGHSQRDCADTDAYMSWVRKVKGKGEDQPGGEVNNIQAGGDCSNFEQMERTQPHKSHQLCGSLEHVGYVKSYRPLSSLTTSNPWSLLTRTEDETYDSVDHDVPPGLMEGKKVHKPIKSKMPRVKTWKPTGDKKDSKYCCWSPDQGGAATWHCLHADGFKSSGMCGKK